MLWIIIPFRSVPLVNDNKRLRLLLIGGSEESHFEWLHKEIFLSFCRKKELKQRFSNTENLCMNSISQHF